MQLFCHIEYRTIGLFVDGPALPIQLSECGAFFGIEHGHKLPALGVAPGRCLHRYFDAFFYKVFADWLSKIQPLAHGAGGGEELFGG